MHDESASKAVAGAVNDMTFRKNSEPRNCDMDTNPSDPSFDNAAPPDSTVEQRQRRPDELARGGDPEAQFRLGFIYASQGTADSFTFAAQWYEKAANQGHALAQFNLGVMYWRGQGFRRDRDHARIWITRAAEAGDPAAQYMLGMNQNRACLDETAAVAVESRIEAYKWLQLAAAQGYGEASAGCDLTAMGMSMEGVKEAMRRASVFVPQPAAEAKELS